METPAGGADEAAAVAGRGPWRALSAQEADKADEAADAAAAAAAAKSATETAKSELDVLSHAIGLQGAEYLLAKPRAVAGDVAARAPRRVGPNSRAA